MQRIPDLLRIYRERAGLTQEEASSTLHLGRSSLVRYENQRSGTTPTFETLCRMLDVYGISWHQLADDLEGKSIEGEYQLRDAEQIRALSDAIAEAVTKSLARNS